MVNKKKLAFNPAYIIGLLVIVLLNMASNSFYKRIDLTKEKRFTISKTSKELANKLDDVVYISVFLDGDLSIEYKRLQNGIKDMLNSFRRESNNNIEYRFEDLLEGKPNEEKDKILRQYGSLGFNIVKAEVANDKDISAKFLIPGAMAVYKGKEYPINFLKREFGRSLDDEINGSLELLEYKIADVVRKCVTKKDQVIAFSTGHGELNEKETADITKALADNYRIESVNLNLLDTNILKPFKSQLEKNPENQGAILLNGIISHLGKYNVLVIAKPVIPFLDEELLLLDQYVMSGGKIILLIDNLNSEMDSVAKYVTMMTASRNLKINDLLFKYGVRVNENLVQDLNSHGIPVMARNGSSKPDFMPWYFYPLFSPDVDHPIVKNLSSVWGRFVNTIDVLPNKEVKKTVLLHSSKNSRVTNNPARVSLLALGLKPTPEMFSQKEQVAAVLLEGTFRSLFAKRRAFKGKMPIKFKELVKNNAMIVISDGDLIRNQIVKKSEEIYPLGYDRYATRHFGEPIVFANKKFFLNCVDYLGSDNDLIEIRSKKLQMRLLNKTRIETERSKWTWINMLGPLLFLVLFGIANHFIRKRKYA